MTWCIVNTLDLSGAPEAVVALESAGRLISLPARRDAVLAAVGEADAYMAAASVRIDRDFLEHAPRLKVIGSPSTGTDHMDVAAIRARGITLFDIARERRLLDGFTATSELAFGLLLALIRKLPAALADARDGVWARERYTGFQLHGKTLGVLGLGRLGTISARIGLGFGMRVIAHDLHEAVVVGVERVDFETLLREPDVLTIHIHLSPETERLIDGAAFARMKRGAILINTSRGRIVDEAALLEALQTGRLAGVGLDVIDGEWLSEADLRAHPLVAYARAYDNLLISPHIGGATVESIQGARVFMAQKLAGFIGAASAQRVAGR